MKNPTPQRFEYTEHYLRDVFGREDVHATAIRTASEIAGLPAISVSSDVGRFLTLLARLTGAHTAIEIGTLGGYSALHLARGLSAGGRLITIESNPRHAAVARDNLAGAGVGNRVRLEIGSALDLLPALAAELGPASIDLAFIDADKAQYGRYWQLLRPMLRAGGLLVADNILGTGGWWIDDETHPDRIAVDRFSRELASDPELETAGVLVRQGLLIARRRSSSSAA